MPDTTKNLPIPNWFFSLLLLLCLTDLTYSAYQHYHAKLDGDIASIVVPKTEYRHVLEDPFGVAAITEGKRYAGANRFFSHYTMKVYFSEVPPFLGRYIDKIDALYWSSAAFKTFVQLLLLLMMGLYAHSMFPLQKESYLLLLFLLTPFFQTMGYAHVLGIVNASITYVFSYSWPVASLLLFYYPFFRSFLSGEPPRISLVGKIGLALLLVYLPFSSPVNAPVILIVSLLYAVGLLLRFAADRPKQKSAVQQWFTEHVNLSTFLFFGAISVVALYAMYLGQFNSENTVSTLPLETRYSRLLQGLGSMLTIKLGYPVLLGSLLISGYLLRNIEESGAAQVRKLLRWGIVFMVIYILLLPLGGYRSYRPYIVRTDTMLPVICGLFVIYGVLAFFILRHLSAVRKKAYALLLLSVAIIFSAADGTNFDQNQQEREGLQTLMESQEEVVVFAKDQLVLSWDNLEKPAASLWNAKLLQQWGLIDTIRLYYNRAE